ncbi:TPA: hypothetical protein MD817_001565 [Klebsiella oxytoca]|uniref:hypothetical protein n=1 Tax=Klebsiella oxytoca TaxID=571 RepID=UPI0015EA023C|nr:hypothetical protein [Klebsiella oxytoca]QLX72219.1 hypothetical protein HV180_07850 [Klebsiella oxytoca]HBV6755442.1 hypothetical protein [Klebsiella oxytoca]HBV8799913.1 hypothetical protein [Klebsiella oxytoca]
MAGFYHRIAGIFTGCWDFMVSLTTSMSISNRFYGVCWRVINYVIKRTSSRPALVIVQWRIIERMCSETIREKLNIFGRNPRNTGALSSPLI